MAHTQQTLVIGERRHWPLAANSLFPGGVGDTEKDPARFSSLIGDVSAKLFDRLPDEVWFYPGHGRLSVPEWHAGGW